MSQPTQDNITLIYNDTTYSFESLNLSHLTRQRNNQKGDSVTFQQYQSPDLPPLFQPNTPIRIYYNHTPWFHGIITHIPEVSSAQNSSKTYHIQGPWWYLEHLVFQQTWLQAENPQSENPTLHPVYKGRLILGQSLDGTPLSVKNQVLEILNYAIQAGAPFQIGTLSLDFNIPLDEVKDISCAQAIQRLLRWSPDSITWFDYSTMPFPTLHIASRSQLQPLLLSSQNIQTLTLTPRYDLQVPSVILKYETTHKTDEHTWTNTQTDAYPLHSQGQEFNSMVLTIDLSGSRSTRIKQKITTLPIEPNSISWWQSHIPELSKIPLEKITLHSSSRQSKLPNELHSGAIAPWMHVESEEDTIQAIISYETPNAILLEQTLCLRLIATDALTQTYTKILTTSPSEIAPCGLAKILYQSLNPLHYQGKITLYTPSFHKPFSLGSTLNINDIHPSYKNMNALVQEIYEDLHTHQTTLHLGPPKHLGPSDLVELLSLNRRRHFSRNANIRHLGYIPANTSIEQSTHTPIQNSGASSGNYQKLTFKHPHSQNTSITLDTTPLPPNINVTLRQELVCENGQLRERFVLCSQPFEINENQ